MKNGLTDPLRSVSGNNPEWSPGLSQKIQINREQFPPFIGMFPERILPPTYVRSTQKIEVRKMIHPKLMNFDIEIAIFESKPDEIGQKIAVFDLGAAPAKAHQGQLMQV